MLVISGNLKLGVALDFANRCQKLASHELRDRGWRRRGLKAALHEEPIFDLRGDRTFCSVDLPAPLGPTRTIRESMSMPKSIPLRSRFALSPSYAKDTSLNARTGGGICELFGKRSFGIGSGMGFSIRPFSIILSKIYTVREAVRGRDQSAAFLLERQGVTQSSVCAPAQSNYDIGIKSSVVAQVAKTASEGLRTRLGSSSPATCGAVGGSRKGKGWSHFLPALGLFHSVRKGTTRRDEPLDSLDLFLLLLILL